MASRWYVVRDKMYSVLFGGESRSVMEVFEGCSQDEAAQELRVEIVQEYADEQAAEGAIREWAGMPDGVARSIPELN